MSSRAARLACVLRAAYLACRAIFPSPPGKSCRLGAGVFLFHSVLLIVEALRVSARKEQFAARPHYYYFFLRYFFSGVRSGRRSLSCNDSAGVPVCSDLSRPRLLACLYFSRCCCCCLRRGRRGDRERKTLLSPSKSPQNSAAPAIRLRFCYHLQRARMRSYFRARLSEFT